MSSPRPTFDRPTAITFQNATRYRWGDAGSQTVDDVIYVSSGGIHQIVFGLPADGHWRHSHNNRTVFGADELYIVLDGTLILCNPETGEVRQIAAGNAAFFRKDTWHHGFAGKGKPTRVLEYMSPPPSQGTSQAYARTRPYLEPGQWRYGEDKWLTCWPAAQAQAAASATITVLAQSDALLRLEGPDQRAVVGLLCSTEFLSAGFIHLPPRASTNSRRHTADASFYVRSGHVRVTCSQWETPTHLGPEDGLFIPAQSEYTLASEDAAVELYFGIGDGQP